MENSSNNDCELDFKNGYALFDDTRFQVVRNDSLAESMLLAKISDLTAMEAPSVRHRLLALITGTLLLMPLTLTLLPANMPGGVIILALFRGKALFGVLFAAFFGIMFLWAVFTSQQIWWIHLKYAETQKYIPLPGADPDRVERFIDALRRALPG